MSLVDDEDSIFTISKLHKCAVNINKWADFQPDTPRPFWRNAESVGRLDPAHSSDGASL